MRGPCGSSGTPVTELGSKRSILSSWRTERPVRSGSAEPAVPNRWYSPSGENRSRRWYNDNALDADGIWAAITDAGLELPDRPHHTDLKGRLVNVFLKCEASTDGEVRGRRNAMLDDSDVHWHRQIKSCVGGVTASVTGDPAVFVSVSAAHQGPEGGGPVAAIIDLGDDPTGYPR